MMTISFTGPRPAAMCGYDMDKYEDLVLWLSHELFKISKNRSEIRFITGGAQGFDQLAFRAVEKLKKNHPQMKIENDVYVPFVGQEKRWPEEGTFGQDEYGSMLDAADNVVFISDEEPQDTEETLEAITARNRRMVRESNIIMALYNGENWTDESVISGAASCMRYAKKRGVAIIQLEYQAGKGGLEITNLKMIAEKASA